MSTTMFFAITAVAVITLILILFPESRNLLSGFLHVFFKDMAATPEGARAIYEEKIEEATEAYNKADDALNRIAGKLSVNKKECETIKRQIQDCESKCEMMVKSGNLEQAQLYAEQREELVADLERKQIMIQELIKAKTEIEEAHKLCEQRLKRLRADQKNVVENMKLNMEMKSVYDDANELKAMTTTDKMLASVKEKDRELKEQVEGAKVIHNNRTSTKIQRADEKARKLQTNDYLETLKKKYNK